MMQWLKATRDFLVACTAVVGVIVSILALWSQTRTAESQIEMAKSQTETASKQAELNLSRELTTEFRQVGEAGKEGLYQRMRNAIAGNEWLYRWAYPEVRKWARDLELCTHRRRPNHGDAGKPLFNDDEINQYLNFLDDLSRYYKSGMLSLETIEVVFGSYIVQAYENLELKRYIDLSRRFTEPMAFKGFDCLATLIEDRPGGEKLAKPWQEVYEGCELQPKRRWLQGQVRVQAYREVP